MISPDLRDFPFSSFPWLSVQAAGVCVLAYPHAAVGDPQVYHQYFWLQPSPVPVQRSPDLVPCWIVLLARSHSEELCWLLLCRGSAALHTIAHGIESIPIFCLILADNCIKIIFSFRPLLLENCTLPFIWSWYATSPSSILRNRGSKKYFAHLVATCLTLQHPFRRPMAAAIQNNDAQSHSQELCWLLLCHSSAAYYCPWHQVHTNMAVFVLQITCGKFFILC